MNCEFKSVDNFSYHYVYPDNVNNSKKKIFINYNESTSPQIYETIKSISALLAKNPELSGCIDAKSGQTFEIRKLSVSIRKLSVSKWQRFARYVTKFFKFYQNESCMTFEVKRVQSGHYAKIENSTLPIPIKGDFNIKPFSDSYTQLATEAFQKYEPEFAARDHQNFLSITDHSQYKIIEINGTLQLVPRNKPSNNDGDTLKRYLDFMIDEYGLEKIHYILHLYNIELKGPLTPEIIYRMNIGVGNLEKQDLDGFIKKIDQLKDSDLLSDVDLRAIFTVHELRGVQRYCLEQGFSLDFETLRHWIKDFQSIDNGQDKQKVALGVLTFLKRDRKKQYTGREILYPIMSKYTIADKKYYKPWVDQQELIQVFEDLKNCSKDGKENWDAYCELLSNVVCKKHLTREHPHEGYRVGALIPAPLDQYGRERFYVVSSFDTDSKGIHSYTLEPLESSMGLSAIKLYGSSDHSKYAIDNINDQIIPLWVGYHLQSAQKSLEPETRIEMLHKTMDAFRDQLLAPYQIKSLNEILSNYNAELIEIAQSLMKKSVFNLISVLRFVNTIFKYEDNASLTNKDDVLFFLSLIDRKNPKYQNLVKELERAALIISDDESKELQRDLMVINVLLTELEKAKTTHQFDEIIGLFHEIVD
jgi:hypothetical protein